MDLARREPMGHLALINSLISRRIRQWVRGLDARQRWRTNIALLRQVAVAGDLWRLILLPSLKHESAVLNRLLFLLLLMLLDFKLLQFYDLLRVMVWPAVPLFLRRQGPIVVLLHRFIIHHMRIDFTLRVGWLEYRTTYIASCRLLGRLATAIPVPAFLDHKHCKIFKRQFGIITDAFYKILLFIRAPSFLIYYD